MQKSLSNFIEQIHHYPDYLLEHQLKNLLEEKEINTLKNLGLLKKGTDLKEIPCISCNNNHFLDVRVDNGKLYCFCPHEDTARNYLAPEEVSTWNFDVEAFLQQLSLKLKIDGNVEKMQIQGLWYIGGFSKDDTRHECYYYQGKNFNEVADFIKKKSGLMKRYVIFTNKQEVSTLETDHSLLLIEVKRIIGLKNNQILFDKRIFDEFLINGFRNVIFSTKNGDLIVNGQIIASITPSTAEYYFVEILWENFNEPVSHQKIKSHIYAKTRKDYEDDPQKLSHKQKNKVKNDSTKPSLIDEIFATTKDFNGDNAYIMRNPSRS